MLKTSAEKRAYLEREGLREGGGGLRGLERVALHADLTMLARLSLALAGGASGSARGLVLVAYPGRVRPIMVRRVAAVGKAAVKAVLKLDFVAVVVHPDDPKVLIAAVAHEIAHLRRPFRVAK